jgi:hypothetical protein
MTQPAMAATTLKRTFVTAWRGSWALGSIRHDADEDNVCLTPSHLLSFLLPVARVSLFS